ncbi:hypothetical protein NE857_21130 [Nocardiopsis exhalans]|uniref:Uncharacterized protein n=1 Tax=Nocardiopsis exhalans TaxID=163604 RepID=A0ABY5D0Q2_9ACTN|nr:hypothetical protein [Nocardiopsis exhalans]USY17824.1 hypothetical protein NE857_21130 [Nocardiopsis exhalans]
MADLDNVTKRKLESILEMSGGYVLDFSNARFADFVKTAIDIDPYEKYPPGSKAVLLRRIWHEEPMAAVAKVNLELLEHWRIGKLVADQEPTSFEGTLYDELKEQFTPLAESVDAASTDFLAKDFGQIDITSLPRSLTSQAVVEARLREIDACQEAGAPLAVIFLVGSTLEGLLMELAIANAAEFTSAPSAPKERGRVKQLDQWKLADLIVVSHKLGILGADVFKFADQVRNFRNYIHPRQQLVERFEPRIETAKIAQQVLRAALADLQQASGGKR